jgi:hypothetical protein
MQIGKVFLLPYDTGRSATGYPVADTWYDDLIVSTTRPNEPTASGSVIINPDTLLFSVQPANLETGAKFNPVVKVSVLLPAGGTDTSFVGSISLAINGCGASLSGTTTQVAVLGVATFTGMGASKIATTCNITSSTSGLTPVVSNNFNVAVKHAFRLFRYHR